MQNFCVTNIPPATRPTLLRQIDMGSFTCAQIWVRAIHILLTPSEKFGLSNLGKATAQPQEQCYPVLQVNAGSFRVSVIHRPQTWIFNECTWSFLHMGVGNIATASQHNIFDSEKLKLVQFFSCSWWQDSYWGHGMWCNWATRRIFSPAVFIFISSVNT